MAVVKRSKYNGGGSDERFLYEDSRDSRSKYFYRPAYGRVNRQISHWISSIRPVHWLEEVRKN